MLPGERVLEEGVTPTTAHIELVRYGDGQHVPRIDPLQLLEPTSE
jgi:hypothetical protein